jgi:hypothetical protein
MVYSFHSLHLLIEGVFAVGSSDFAVRGTLRIRVSGEGTGGLEKPEGG